MCKTLFPLKLLVDADDWADWPFFGKNETYAAFIHVGLTTRYRTKSWYKSIFVLSRSHDI